MRRKRCLKFSLSRRGFALLSAFIFAVVGAGSASAQEPVDKPLPEVTAPVESDSPAQHDAAAEEAAAASPDASAETSVETPVAPVANSRALEESSLSNQRGHDEFKRPLLFAPEDNGLQPENPQIKWDMDASGDKINLGGLKLSASLFNLKIDQTKRSEAPRDISASREGSASVVNLSFSWPTLLAKSGLVSIESLDGTVAWSIVITEQARANWRKKLARHKNTLLHAHLGAQWGLTDLPAVALKPFRGGAPFRMCLAQTNSELEKLRACTRPYSFQQVAKGRQIVALSERVTPTVFLGSKAIGAHGLVNLPLGKLVELKIAFADGSTIDLASQPAALSLLDVVESKDGREIILTGRLNQPLGKKKIVSRPESHFWAATGVEQDTIWQIALPNETPTLRVLGAFNLPFTFLFRYEKLPTEADRVFVREATATGTYSSEPLLFGYSEKVGSISSSEESAKKTDDHHFEWTFAAPEIGQRNRARISLIGPPDRPGTWVAHHRLYRGFPIEASARLAGVLGSSGSLIVLGEIAGSVWLESLGFTQNDLISRQRWGLTSRYFRSLTAIQSAQGVSVSDFTVINADLKYNIMRGIWNRDQLFGIMGSLQSVTLAGLQSSMSGGGVYWARTMPKIFAELFDKFPLLDYSKYVDVEFVYYPFLLSNQIQTGNSYSLNFHGKVFWTPRLYGEAGFGIRKYYLADVSANRFITFATAYGNVGIGLIF